MKRVISIAICASLLSGQAWSAVVSVCASGCTTTSLQTAFDSAANCGDTIQIKSTEEQVGNFVITDRGCTANPITVTSDRAAWLPPQGVRITPSQLANMAHITTNNSNSALADGVRVSWPPAGTLLGWPLLQRPVSRLIT